MRQAAAMCSQYHGARCRYALSAMLDCSPSNRESTLILPALAVCQVLGHSSEYTVITLSVWDNGESLPYLRQTKFQRVPMGTEEETADAGKHFHA